MGRISSRYNYRLAKGKKGEPKKKKTNVEDIVLRNKKKKLEKKQSIEKKNTAIDKKIVNSTPKKAIRRNVSKEHADIKKNVTLENIKDYCYEKRILLVGNSKDIIRNKYGSQIDSYDVVVRMNHGHPIDKYILNMGQKYNIWAHGFLNHKKQINEYQKIKNLVDFHIETNELKLCKRIFDKKAFLIPRRWYKDNYEKNHKGKEMSTGLNTAMFFIDWIGTMKEIAIVGFDFLKTSNPVLQSGAARKFHNTDEERESMIDLLNKSGIYIPFNDKYNFAK